MLELSRRLRNWRVWLTPRYDNKSIFAKFLRWICWNLISPVETWLRQKGERRFLFYQHHGNAGTEIRTQAFLRLRLFVEGYLANVAHRYFENQSEQLPASAKKRGKIGVKVLRSMGHTFEQKRKCRELAKIYEWIVDEYPGWHNPYWKEAPMPTLNTASEGGIFEPMSDEQREKWDRLTSRAERLDRIIEERIEHRAQLLFEYKDLLMYD